MNRERLRLTAIAILDSKLFRDGRGYEYLAGTLSCRWKFGERRNDSPDKFRRIRALKGRGPQLSWGGASDVVSPLRAIAAGGW
jgi:hypothetical protein